MRLRTIAVALGGAMLTVGCGDEALMNEDSASVLRAVGSVRENLVVAAVGLGSQPAVLEVDVPIVTAADVVSARFRWVARGSTPAGDPTVLINGYQRSGTLLASYEVGGDLPWVFFYEYENRALIRRGLNRFYVSGCNPPQPSRADGIAVIVTYHDESSPWTSILTVDPLEFVNAGSGAVWDFPVGVSASDRNGRLVLLAGDCTAESTDRLWWSAGTGPVPEILVGTAANVLTDRLVAAQGPRVDVLTEDVTIPAGASHFAYQLESPADGTGDSILHFFGAVCTDGETTDCTASVSGRVWRDDDRDGAEDPDEPGLAGLAVNLHVDPGVVVATAATDESGAFTFEWLCAGDYFVEIDKSTLPAGFEATTCGGGDCSPQPVSVPANDSVVSGLAFGWAEPPPPSSTCFLGPGFWKHQYGVLCGERSGHLHLDPEKLHEFLRKVDAVAAEHWSEGLGPLDPSEAFATLSGHGPSTRVKFERHWLACLLNYGLNGAHPGLPVDTDRDGQPDTTFGALIDSVDALVAAGDDVSLREATRLATSVNDMPGDDCPF